MLEDTQPAALERYVALLRSMTPEQRARATLGMCRGVRRAVILGLRAQHPGISDEELRVRLMARVYGRSEALRVFGHVPDDAW